MDTWNFGLVPKDNVLLLSIYWLKQAIWWGIDCKQVRNFGKFNVRLKSKLKMRENAPETFICLYNSFYVILNLFDGFSVRNFLSLRAIFRYTSSDHLAFKSVLKFVPWAMTGWPCECQPSDHVGKWKERRMDRVGN